MFSALILAVPLAVAPAGGQPQTPPDPTSAPAPLRVKLDCVVQPDRTVKDCVITNMPSVDQDQALLALHAVEARTTPVPNGAPGDKIHIVMTPGS